jgi:P-type E1-E2 ATPase
MFMQMVPAISITGGSPALLPPLCFVILVSMVKDAYEDYLRHKKDNEENDAICQIIHDGVLVETKWKDVRIGQVLQVNEDQFFPADMLTIHSGGEDGLCYVETKNLDGETNLKHKFAPKELNEFFLSPQVISEDLETSVVTYEAPNN